MITSDIQKLEPGDRVDLFELDMTKIGADIMRFHPYPLLGSIWWQGVAYEPWAIESEGFELQGEGAQPTPTLRVGNIGDDGLGNPVAGVISALCIQLNDLVGSKLTKRTTLSKYLDEKNFPEGNPSADPDMQFPESIWFIEQKTSETRHQVEFELKTALDLNGKLFPDRRIVTNMCSWLLMDSEQGGGYRGSYCGYTGNKMFDEDGKPVKDPTKDRCGGRVSDCKKRFGEYSEINFGSFPSADNLRGY